MKKTMFITSIVMVVVLAVALTTSSLAWFAAGGNQSVTVTAFQIQAKNNAAAAGLEISNTGSVWRTDNINLLTAEELALDNNATENLLEGISRNGFLPLAPVGAISLVESKKSHNDLYKLLRDEMYTSETYRANEVDYMKTAPVQGAALDRDFYVRNTGESATNVTVTINVAVDTSQAARTYNATLWVALFDETGAVYQAKLTGENPTPASLTGNVSLLSIVSSKKTAQGAEGSTGFTQPTQAWAANATMASVNGQTCALNDIATVTLALEAAADTNNDGVLDYTPHHLRLFAWFDGSELDNQNSDTKVNISLTFNI